MRFRFFALLILAANLFIFLSCSTSKSVTEVATQSRTDVLVQRVTTHTRDTIYIDLPREAHTRFCRDSSSYLETSFARSSASVDSFGFLRHTLENLPNTLPVLIDSVFVFRDSIVYVDSTKKSFHVEETTNRAEVLKWEVAFFVCLIFAAAVFVKHIW